MRTKTVSAVIATVLTLIGAVATADSLNDGANAASTDGPYAR